MSKLQEEINQDVDAKIKANGIGEITGPMMNGVLREMITTLHGVHFQFPINLSQTNPVSDNDIGKLMMADENGFAQVYKLCDARVEQKGKWELTVHDLVVTSSAQIRFQRNGNDNVVNRFQWLSGHPYPSNSAAELSLIQIYLSSSIGLGSNYSYNISNNVLTIEELTYQETFLIWDNQDVGFMKVIRESLPAAPRAPANFPLGKLVGVSNDVAMISCAHIETYNLVGTVNVVNELFSYNSLFQINMETGLNLASCIILPYDNGAVAPLDTALFEQDGSFFKNFRHHIVGFAISTSGTTVTVMSFTQFSFVGSIIFKLFSAGLKIKK